MPEESVAADIDSPQIAQRRAMQSGRAFVILAVMVAILIVYGSLYPFDFGPRVLPQGVVPVLLESLQQWPGKGDAIANVLLYVPLGFFGLIALPRRLAGWMRCLAIVIVGTALSAGIEFAQVWTSSRVPSLFDILFNVAGTGIGAGAGLFLGRDLGLRRLRLDALRPTPIFLLTAWAGYHFAPFVPALDLHQFKHALKPLLLTPTVPPLQVAHHAIHWLVIASLLNALFTGKRAAVAVLIAAAAASALPLFIAGKQITAPAITGMSVGLIAWFAVLQGRPWRRGVIAGLFCALYLVEGLKPFEVQSVQGDFHWSPFHGFLNSTVLAGVEIFLEKTFTYGAMLWLLTRCGIRLSVALLVVVAPVSAVEWAQTWLPGRTAEITDPLMVILASVVIWLVETPDNQLMPVERAQA